MSDIFSIPLHPLVKDSPFQPTGFPDIGAVTFRNPDGDSMLLVESEQSMANRLEDVCWDESSNDVVEDLKGLPYVRVMKDGNFYTSSILEAHRLNSGYIVKTTFFRDAFGVPNEEGALTKRAFIQKVMEVDPCSLIHGLFMSTLSNDFKTSRALSGFILAKGVEEVLRTGTKKDHISASGDEDSGQTSKTGFGNIIHSRSDFTAREITGWFKLNQRQINSYPLTKEEKDFLVNLSFYKILSFLSGSLELRSNCELVVETLPSTLPSLENVRENIRKYLDVHGKNPFVTDFDPNCKPSYTKSSKKKEEKAKEKENAKKAKKGEK